MKTKIKIFNFNQLDSLFRKGKISTFLIYDTITGEPCSMREIGTKECVSHITNLHIKRPMMTLNLRIGPAYKKG